ncbi:hypothetical protein PspLS_09949 [Pyricularia sp. CBS 133598]|nr:hypothetical protein PspLS_09949 [Pyricularia sp. CBS 133598]
MLFRSLIAAAAALHGVLGQELMRFGCSQLVVDRLDPLVNPGQRPSPHMHQIVGGNSFNASMPPVEYDPAKLSTCTSCTYSEDFSNYWTANVYFRARNGSFKRVPQVGNLGLNIKGGITVYYLRGYQASARVTAFKPGFRMLVGDPVHKNAATQQRQLCFRCEANMQQFPFGGAPCTGADTQEFPKQPCGGGWRVSVHFPSCWDGKNVDSPDHKSHVLVAYPQQGTFESGGACPSTHPVKIPQLMYEVMFDTRQFNDRSLWPTDGSQPFFWSNGERTGLGNHGDYIFGWKGDALQRAMDSKCANDRCPALQRQTDQQAQACTKERVVKEEVGDEWLDDIPGQTAANYL